MRFGMWNVRRLNRAYSITAAARDLVGARNVTWDQEGTVKAEICNFFYGKGNETHQLEQNFLYTAE